MDAQLGGERDLSDGVDLMAQRFLKMALDGGPPAEIDLRAGAADPRAVTLDELADAINDAQEAERIGLVTMVVPHEELEVATLELAEKLAKGPPLAIQKSKRAVYEGLEMDLKR